MSEPLYELLRRLLFLPAPGSQVARRVDHLHFFVISVTFAGAFAVFAVALYFIVRYRRRGAKESTPRIVAPKSFELITGGILLSLFIAWWVIGFRQYVELQTPPKDAVAVYVTAKQWMWKFTSPTGRSSAGIVVVPAGEDVKFIITSRDVVHSFYVPSFRIKQDAIPGRYTTAWLHADHPGTYPVYCAEFCGLDHSRMWATLVAVKPAEYEQWLRGRMPPPVARAVADSPRASVEVGKGKSLAERGRTVAEKHACFSCHTTDGQPHIGPTWQGLYGSMVTLDDGTRVRADAAYLTESMMDPLAKVVKGFKPVMPTFQGSLSQPDTAAVVEFIRSLRDQHREPSVALPAVSVEADAGPAQDGGSP